MNNDSDIYECGEGWHPIIDRALDELRALDPDLDVSQIKEKFGHLDMYVYPSDLEDELMRARFNKIIGAAETLALETCEVCGSTPARLHASRGWYRTLCDNHAVE